MNRASVRVFTLTLLLSCAVATPALAAPTDMATAEALFDQGKELMRAGKYDEACPKFAESQRLDPGVGTLLGLGECYERTGRLASAWATFREASALARTAGDAKRDAVAQQRYARLEPMLPKLVVSVKPTSGAEVTVTDGAAALSKATWGAPMPVDPGEHTIRATASGHEAWTATVHVDKGETKTVEVPPLVPTSAAAPATPAEPPPAQVVEPPPASEPSSSRGISPLTLGAFGIGVVGLGVGAGFGLAASSKASDLDAVCKPTCPPDRNEDLRAARTQAWVSNIGFAVGIVGVAVGTYSLFFRDRGAPAASRVTPAVAIDGRSGHVGVAGTF